MTAYMVAPKTKSHGSHNVHAPALGPKAHPDHELKLKAKALHRPSKVH